MESQQVWSNVGEKIAYLLVLRGPQVYLLKVTGMSLMLNRKVKGILEELQQGKGPADSGAKLVETVDARALSKIEVDPDSSSLTLFGEGDKPSKLTFSTVDNDAEEIIQAIQAQSGRTFRATQEEIGVFEALIPPVIAGVVGGLLWVALFLSASQLAAGQAVEAKGRRSGLQSLLIGVAETLGIGGTVAVGLVLLALIFGWGALRLIHRPERTVWLPEGV